MKKSASVVTKPGTPSDAKVEKPDDDQVKKPPNAREDAIKFIKGNNTEDGFISAIKKYLVNAVKYQNSKSTGKGGSPLHRDRVTHICSKLDITLDFICSSDKSQEKIHVINALLTATLDEKLHHKDVIKSSALKELKAILNESIKKFPINNFTVAKISGYLSVNKENWFVPTDESLINFISPPKAEEEKNKVTPKRPPPPPLPPGRPQTPRPPQPLQPLPPGENKDLDKPKDKFMEELKKRVELKNSSTSSTPLSQGELLAQQMVQTLNLGRETAEDKASKERTQSAPSTQTSTPNLSQTLTHKNSF